jgi:hypothetical protein
MKSITELWGSVTERIKSTPRDTPTAFAIPASHVDEYDPAEPPSHFIADEHYFVVQINEMFLESSRKWFTGIDPVVFVVSEFTYNGQTQVVPCLVGPSMIQNAGTKLPQGMLFRNTRVAGIHPYRGGRLTLSVVLCELTVKNYARQILGVLETVGTALDFATAISTYVKVAGVMLDAVDALMESGDARPLAGLREEFDDGSRSFSPGFFVLVNKPAVNPKTLWVRRGQLYSGPSAEAATPFREADFVLYSLVRPPDNKRNDLSTLPFFPLWQRVQSEAADPRDSSYESARHNIVSLSQSILLSADLVDAQKDVVTDDYIRKLEQYHQRAIATGKRAATDGQTTTGLDAVRAKSMAFLKQ